MGTTPEATAPPLARGVHVSIQHPSSLCFEGRRDSHGVVRTLLVALALVAAAVRVEAYETYDDGHGYGCVSCHPRYFDDPGSPTPLGSLHVAHLTKFGINQSGKCGLCHMNPNG